MMTFFFMEIFSFPRRFFSQLFLENYTENVKNHRPNNTTDGQITLSETAPRIDDRINIHRSDEKCTQNKN